MAQMGHSRRRIRRLVGLAWLSGSAGFGASAAQVPPSSDSAHRPLTGIVRDISGTWQGTFTLDSTWRLRERALVRSIPARLHFNPVGDASPTTSSARSVHQGMFEIDFARFGITLSTQEALGWSVTADSMGAVLNPTVDHGLVELHGTFRGDAVIGTWKYVSDPGGATGKFEIRRAQAR
jgi:hypothetical protein